MNTASHTPVPDVYAQYFDSTLQPLILLDNTGIIIKPNASSLQLIKSDEADYIGQFFANSAWWSYKLLRGLTVTAAILKAADGQTSTAMAMFPSANGVCVIDFTFIPLRNAYQTIEHIMAEGIDITESVNALRYSH